MLEPPACAGLPPPPVTIQEERQTAEGDHHLQLKAGASDTAQTEVVRQEILRLWPTRDEMVMYFVRQKIVDGVWQGDFALPGGVGAAAAKYIAANVKKIDGSADLRGYAHALPLLAHIGGDADLRGYAHALPVLAHIGGDAYLEGYAHALPLLAHIGGFADLRGYAHPLSLLAHIGWDAYLEDYAHPLPQGCEVQGRIYK